MTQSKLARHKIILTNELSGSFLRLYLNEFLTYFCKINIKFNVVRGLEKYSTKPEMKGGFLVSSQIITKAYTEKKSERTFQSIHINQIQIACETTNLDKFSTKMTMLHLHNMKLQNI